MVVLHGSLGMIACLQLLVASSFCSHVEGKMGFGGSGQEWGHVIVGRNGRMFWWLYYTTSTEVMNTYEKPLLIWLQGGPGASSTGYGNFEEIGPLDLDLKPRNYSWVNDYNILFIDSPVGAGYSYTDSDHSFAKTNAQIGADLLNCIRRFLKKNPKFETVPTFIVGESYGGKMAAEFARVWYKDQKNRRIKSNLKGVALGAPWISPIDSVLSWGKFLLNTGMVDTDGFNRIEKAAVETKQAVDNGEWSRATELWGYTMYIAFKETGNIDFFNILYKTSVNHVTLLTKVDPSSQREISGNERDPLNKLMNGIVKTKLSLNVTWGAEGGEVFSKLSGDYMKPATHTVERLLNETDIEVFVFTGQLDFIVATPGTVVWVENLKWRNSTEWHAAPRKPLEVDNIIEGYVKQYSNLKMFWINRAGHMVPKDNPAAMKAILKRLTQ